MTHSLFDPEMTIAVDWTLFSVSDSLVMRLEGGPRGWGSSGFEPVPYSKEMLYTAVVSEKESLSRAAAQFTG